MAGLIGKLVFNRILKETRENNEGRDDPYFETVPTKKLSSFAGNTKLKRRKKALPPGLSDADQKTLVKVKRRAYRLDMALGTFCGMKLGWGSVIGIVPGIGDAIDALLAMMVIRTATEVGLPSSVVTRMALNVIFDFLLGLVPFLGDLADMAYKANTRNAIILEDYLRQRGKENVRKSGLPVQFDPSQGEVEYEDDTGVVNDASPTIQAYDRAPRSKHTSRGRDYDVEAQTGGARVDGSSSSKHHGRSGKKSSKDKKTKSSKGHSRLTSQETGVL